MPIVAIFSILDKLLTYLVSDPWRIGCVGLLAFAGVQTCRIDGLPILGGGFRHDLAAETVKFNTEHDGRTADRAEYKQAQAAATKIATDHKLTREAFDARNKEVHDNALPQALAQGLAADAVYARTHGVHYAAPAAVAGGPGSADLSPAGTAPQVADGPGDQTFVAISKADLDVCTTGIERLINAHDWSVDEDIATPPDLVVSPPPPLTGD